jgi:hypothetical protein
MLRQGAGNPRPMLILQGLWHSEQFAVILLAFACLLGLEGDVNLKVHQAEGATARYTSQARHYAGTTVWRRGHLKMVVLSAVQRLCMVSTVCLDRRDRVYSVWPHCLAWCLFSSPGSPLLASYSYSGLLLDLRSIATASTFTWIGIHASSVKACCESRLV